MKRRHFLTALAGAASAPLFGVRAAERAPERTTDHAPFSNPFQFAVVGDLFNRDEGVEEATSLLNSIGRTSARFILDVGSVKSNDERCSDELLEQRAALFNTSTIPFVPVAAQSEWLSCSSAKEGGFDPGERLEALRQELFGSPQTMGTSGFGIARESGVRQFRPFSENARFEMERILVVTMNLPSPNNDYRLAGGRNGEFEDRIIANHVWLERAFRYADLMRLAGVVVAVEADPEFSRPLRAPDHRSPRRDGFYEFKMELRDAVQRFRGQVLLIHSSDAGYLIDQPLQDASGHVLKNFTRVRSLASSYAGSWLEVAVDARTPRVFRVVKRSADASDVKAAT
jgi:hypothetical protein